MSNSFGRSSLNICGPSDQQPFVHKFNEIKMIIDPLHFCANWSWY